MKTPTLLFTDDFTHLLPEFRKIPHQTRHFRKGEQLWEIGQPYDQIFYIFDGVVQAVIEHEAGFHKILSFHGQGTIYPGYHENKFRLEDAITLTALTNTTTLVFTYSDFGKLYYQSKSLQQANINWFSTYVNLLLYDVAHQTYNSSLIKLANLYKKAVKH